MEALAKQARAAGILYFVTCITGPFCLVYVPRALLVAGDVTATANHVRASETLLRLGIASELFCSTLFVFAALAFYRLFKSVDPKLAVLMAALVLVSVPVSLLNSVNHLGALMLARGAPFLPALEQSQRDALIYLFVRLHAQGNLVAGIFWGLWLFPLGMLVVRSGFIPRIVGVFLMLAGAGYVATTFASILLPQYVRVVSLVAMVLAFGELPFILWLLIWGAKAQSPGSSPETSVPARA
jgi:hypothetical protein